MRDFFLNVRDGKVLVCKNNLNCRQMRWSDPTWKFSISFHFLFFFTLSNSIIWYFVNRLIFKLRKLPQKLTVQARSMHSEAGHVRHANLEHLFRVCSCSQQGLWESCWWHRQTANRCYSIPKDSLYTYTVPTGWNFRARKDSAPFAEGWLLHGPQPLWLPAGSPGHWSVKYVGVSGEFKQTAGVKSKLRKVFSSFGGETELFAFSRRLFMERAGWEIEQKDFKFGKNHGFRYDLVFYGRKCSLLAICCSHFLVCITDISLILNYTPHEKKAICMYIELLRLGGLRCFHYLSKYLKVMGIWWISETKLLLIVHGSLQNAQQFSLLETDHCDL